MKKLISLDAHNRLNWAMKENIENIFIKLKTGVSSLSNDSIEIMREAFGKNKISDKKKDSALKKFIFAFINPFTMILFILARVSLFTEVILVNSENKDFTGV